MWNKRPGIGLPSIFSDVAVRAKSEASATVGGAWRWAMIAGLLVAGPVWGEPSSDAQLTTLQLWQQFYGVPDECLDRDDDLDSLIGRVEADGRLTDPYNKDTDYDGENDASDTEISNGYLPISDPQFLWAEETPFGWTNAPAGVRVEYAKPEWIESVVLISGSWLQEPTVAWQGARDNSGLFIKLDRRQMTNDVLVQLAVAAATAEAGLRVKLLDAGGGVLAADVAVETSVERGEGDALVATWRIPLRQWPAEATVVGLCPTADNALWLLEGLISPAGDPAGGTSAAPAGIPGPAPDAAPATSGPSGGQAPALRLTATGRKQFAGSQQAASPARMAVTAPGNGLTVARLLQASLNFRITRSELSGGGRRQTSSANNFIMEDTIAQPSPIGWLSSDNFTLHAGYQQAEECVLPVFFNVGTIGTQMNPTRGEITTISYVLAAGSANMTITITDGITTYTLLNGVYQGPGLHTVTWNGKQGANPVANGLWTVTITAGCGGQTRSTTTTVRVRSNTGVFKAVSDSPEPFCGATTIAYTLDDNGNPKTEVVIRDAAGGEVRRWDPASQGIGSFSVVWDGADNGGAPVRDGLYVYTITSGSGGNEATEVSGAIVRACLNTVATSADGGLVEVRHQPSATVIIAPVSGALLNNAMWAIAAAAPALILQSTIYEITPSQTFNPPAILTLKYDSALDGQIDSKLQIRRYDTGLGQWVVVPNQYVDYANHQVIAELPNLLSVYALFTGEDLTPFTAGVRLEPEVLQINPGVLTAFVSLPEGYPEANIEEATCDGAAFERKQLNADGTQAIFKFRREAVAAALAAQGQPLDTRFVVRCTWTNATRRVVFEGADTIQRVDY